MGGLSKNLNTKDRLYSLKCHKPFNVYVDDLVLIPPLRTGVNKLLKICKSYWVLSVNIRYTVYLLYSVIYSCVIL